MFKIKLLSDLAIQPKKAFEGDAGFDVYSAEPQHVVLGPEEHYKFKLGFAIEIPEGYVGIIAEKSGMANADGIMTIGNIIDSNYRGEVHAILHNLSKKSVVIDPEQKVAQLLIMPCNTGIGYKLVMELSNTNRGKGGFGSTGLFNNDVPGAIIPTDKNGRRL